MQQQHLDPLGVTYGILQPLVPDGRDERNPDFGQAICQAMNEWQVAEWADKEPRLKASICLPWDEPKAAVAEIERNAGRREFAQIFVQPRLREPLGTRRYWPIYEAAAKHDLPIGMHSGGSVGSAPTGIGWLSYYAENQYAYALCMQMAVSNLIFEGVLDEFPTLRFILVEAGFAWVPAFGWRIDYYWSRLRSEVPHLKKRPSEYLKNNFWFTTQPVDEPEKPADILELIDWIGADKILFATDYPHWDSDDPRHAFRVALPQSMREMILSRNAHAVFGLN
jgi:predicted TIM-barrel fold metal-dependent hydrolase